jgi:hypothetical protein
VALPSPGVSAAPDADRGAESPQAARASPFRGVSLRPSDAVDPYQYGRYAPDKVGLHQVGAWCPSCQGSLQLVTMCMCEAGLYLEGICYTCGAPPLNRPGIYKRMVIALPWRRLPPVDED